MKRLTLKAVISPAPMVSSIVGQPLDDLTKELLQQAHDIRGGRLSIREMKRADRILGKRLSAARKHYSDPHGRVLISLLGRMRSINRLKIWYLKCRGHAPKSETQSRQVERAMADSKAGTTGAAQPPAKAPLTRKEKLAVTHAAASLGLTMAQFMAGRKRLKKTSPLSASEIANILSRASAAQRTAFDQMLTTFIRANEARKGAAK